jgi:hypothetical protein
VKSDLFGGSFISIGTQMAGSYLGQSEELTPSINGQTSDLLSQSRDIVESGSFEQTSLSFGSPQQVLSAQFPQSPSVMGTIHSRLSEAFYASIMLAGAGCVDGSLAISMSSKALESKAILESAKLLRSNLMGRSVQLIVAVALGHSFFHVDSPATLSSGTYSELCAVWGSKSYSQSQHRGAFRATN